MSVFSKYLPFSTLPQYKINSACSGMSYHAANSQLAKELNNKKKKTVKMIQNQQPGEDTRKPITELQKEYNCMISRKKYSDLEGIHKYTGERDNKRI